MLYKYSRWGGTQNPDSSDAQQTMDQVADELLRDGDIHDALRRLLQRGMPNPNGRRRQGLQDLLNRLRQSRAEKLSRYNLEPMLDDIKKRLDEIIDSERQTLEDRLDGDENPDSPRHPEPAGEGSQGGERRPSSPSQDGARRTGNGAPSNDFQKMLENLYQKRMDALDNLRPDVGGRVGQLRDYDFVNPDARQKFDDLLKQLQQQVMQNYFQGLQQGIQSMTPEMLRTTQQMVRDLNKMLEDKARGREPDFKGFMDKWGQMFPEGIDSLDKLLEHMQRQMDQMESLLRSMSPEQRQELEDLMESLLRDHSLQVDLARLAQNLHQLVPGRGAPDSFDFMGDEPVTLQEALKLMGDMNKMDELEKQLFQAARSNDASKLDADEIGRLLGEEAKQTAEQLRQITKMLEEAGLLRRNGDEWELTPRAMRKIGERALQDIFGKLRQGVFGPHNLDKKGVGIDLLDETRAYRYGDPFAMDVQRSVMNAVKRTGGGTPIHITPQDFEVREAIARTECSTVIMLDMSYSMIGSGCFQAARKVALALDTLIRSKYPRDNLYVVAFSYFTMLLQPRMLLDSKWVEYGGGTNMQQGLREARRVLGKHKTGTRQVILITDGRPTTYTNAEGQVVGGGWGRYWPSSDVLEATLREVSQCTRENIVINTFMMASDRSLAEFVRMMTKLNKGRAFFTTPDHLGQYILVDYLGNKHKSLH